MIDKNDKILRDSFFNETEIYLATRRTNVVGSVIFSIRRKGLDS